ncbi:hypothetical protein [Paenibacillus xylanexedens]|uniref:hypothetical protein n=1 Tax=Paenibacillus sp. FSL R7-0272 TaxID=2921679 RepID=UPI0012B6EAAB|nr:hypothetical protein [Paenibacillus xylanexedens]
MTIKQLPVYTPYIKSYKHHALKLSLIGDKEEYISWILSNYIQLYNPYNFIENKDCDPHWLDFFLLTKNNESNPWLELENIHFSDLKRNDVIQFIENSIDNGSYLYLYYNAFYIEHSFAYKQEHTPSNLLIYGYNKTKQVFLVLDYHYDEMGNRLKHLEVQYNTLHLSLKNLNLNSHDEGWAEFSQICTVKENKMEIRIQDIIDTIEEYLLSSQTYKKSEPTNTFFQNSKFGISVYEALLHYLDSLQNQEVEINILPISILCEHKKVLYQLSLFLSHSFIIKESICNELKSLKNDMLIVKNLLIKFSIKREPMIIDSIRSKVLLIINIEKRVIPQLLQALKAQTLYNQDLCT